MCIVNYGMACTVAARKSYEMAGVTARDIDLGGASLAGPCPVTKCAVACRVGTRILT